MCKRAALSKFYPVHGFLEIGKDNCHSVWLHPVPLGVKAEKHRLVEDSLGTPQL